MRRITILFTVAAMMAVLLSISAGPASARVIFNGDNGHNFDRNGGFVFRSGGDHFFGNRDFGFNRGGGVSFELGDVDNDSGDVELENSFEISGNNNNACLGQLQFGNTGNFTNQQGVVQFDRGVDFNRDHRFDRDHRSDWWGNRFDWGHRFDDDDDRHDGFVFRDGDNNGDVEFSGPDVTFAPVNETACDQAVQQSAAASSWDD